MENKRLEALVNQGEGMTVEFKRCGNKPGRDVFETICAFANRQGGNLLLGVLDDGEVCGIPGGEVLSVERNIANVTSDPNLFSSTPVLEFERMAEGDATVLRVWVPIGPSVYRYKGVVYDRVADADIRVTSDARVNAIYNRKQGIYTERRVLAWATMECLDPELIARARAMAAASRGGHPWASMGDEELVRSARLWYRDPESGDEGLTLAAVMLLGTDDAIFDAVPAYRTDALLRRDDEDRYDDRLTVRTNLIDSYDLLAGFCRKWLPDPFALDGDRRVSPRDVIVRELVSNMLIHREYANPHSAQLVIGRDGISTRNASRSLFTGRITPENLDPTPKNPGIAGFFAQIGLAEELGSGTRNLFKFSRLYSGAEPVLEDGDFFSAFIPVPGALPGQRHATGDGTFEAAVVAFLRSRGVATAAEIADATVEAPRTTRRKLASMVNSGAIERIGAGRSTAYRLAANA